MSNIFTITDVAKAAGVSVSTVSRILNGKQDVAPATRERVQRVIEELGYTPHAQAQRLRAGKTRNIALIFPLKYPGKLPYNTLEMDFIIGAAAACGEQEFFFSLHTMPVSKRTLVGLYRSAQIDGLILMQIHSQDWRVELLRHHDYPFVMIGHRADNTGLSFIDLDFEAAVITAFDHVVALGHRQIGFLALPADMRQRGFGPAVREWAGYQHSLRTYNLPTIYREVSYATQDIFAATLSMLDEHPELTAIVTTHELAALSVVEALRLRGRSIPDDCSVVALTTEKIAELITLPLTYIDFPSYSMGYRAVDLLIRTLANRSRQPEQILLPPHLLIRGSTAPAK